MIKHFEGNIGESGISEVNHKKKFTKAPLRTEGLTRGRNRAHVLATEIDDESVNRVMSFLSAHDNEGFQTLYISSGGGYIYSAYALYHFLANYEKQLDVVFFGYCASATVMLVAAGRNPRVNVQVERGTHFMLHPITEQVSGNSKKIAQYLIHNNRWIEEIYEPIYEEALQVLNVPLEMRKARFSEEVHFIY